METTVYHFFQMAECMMLFEDRTLLFHLSGLAVGLFAATLSSPKEFLASRFPGRGQRLGRGSGTNRHLASAGPLADVTRSWGYAGQEARFRSGGTWTAHSSAHSGQPQAGNFQVWSLTQFYSVDFSQSRIGVNKCVFYKRTVKVSVSCC